MKIVLLDAKTLGSDIDLSAINRFGDVVIYQTTKPEETTTKIKGADIVITNKVVVDRRHMAASPSLHLICIAATGMNNVDLAYAREKGIEVKNVAGYSTESVVQLTFSQVLYLLHQHAEYDAFGKNEWKKCDIFSGLDHSFYEIFGKRWGIIGLGSIGRRVAEVARSFGCEVVYYSTSGKNNTKDYLRLALDELLQSSRIISVHAPLNPQTKNLIDYEKLALVRAGAIIVNMGRGGIINEADLAQTIDERSIYAGVDVTTIEPIKPDNPLLRVTHKERLSITPHIAWASIEARKRLVAGITANIEEFLSKK